MICFEAGTVDDKAQGDVAAVPVSPAWITPGTRDQSITPIARFSSFMTFPIPCEAHIAVKNDLLVREI
jgi:hypothetical protein